MKGVRWRAFRFVSSRTVQIGLLCLLLTDVIALVVELVLDAEYPTCSSVQNIGYCGPTMVDTDKRAVWDSMADANDTVPLCKVPPAGIEGAHLALFIVSISILSLFLIEIGLTIYTLRFKFFRNPLYVIDAMIVSASLAIEAWAESQPDEPTSGSSTVNRSTVDSIADVLIFIRLWRFVRIAHGIYTVAHDEAERVEKENELLHRKLKMMHRSVHKVLRADMVSARHLMLESVPGQVHHMHSMKSDDDDNATTSEGSSTYETDSSASAAKNAEHK